MAVDSRRSGEGARGMVWPGAMPSVRSAASRFVRGGGECRVGRCGTGPLMSCTPAGASNCRSTARRAIASIRLHVAVGAVFVRQVWLGSS